MSTTPLRERIRAIAIPGLRPYVSRVELFGSVARGEETSESDIDLLVTLRPEEERPLLGLQWFEIEHELSDQLGRPVKLVTERALSRHVLPHIQADRLVLYEASSPDLVDG